MKGIDIRAFDGFVIVDKEAGFTSQDAVLALKRHLSAAKAGHSGTLDRFATGVLPILLGRYTRLMRFFMEGPKAYSAEIRFGTETATLDPEGETTGSGPLPTKDDILSALDSFRGEILQAPPEYSAVHIDGKRAYERVLAGEKPEMKSRPVRIDRLEMVSYEEGTAVLEVECSKGTYIRSLARDIARDCGTVAFLSALRRTRAAGLLVSRAKKIELVGPGDILLLDEATASGMGLGIARIKGSSERNLLDGKRISGNDFLSVESPKAYHAVFSAGRFLAVLSGIESGQPSYEAVIGGRA